jgi:hypothetical protein
MVEILRKDSHIDLIFKKGADVSIFSIQRDASQISIQWKNGTLYGNKHLQAINLNEYDLIVLRDSINEVLSSL